MRFLYIFIFLIGVFFLPQAFLRLQFENKMFSSIETLPVKEYGILFGARVDGENQLSPIVKERADAAILLFKASKISKVFVSGTNRANAEADNLAKYLVSQGIPQEVIIIDGLGIDTEDTCRHMQARSIQSATLLTQGFHLPRALLMCSQRGIDSVGMAVNNLDLLADRGGNTFEIVQIRVTRFIKESALTWSYLLGTYSWYSHEAEMIEKGK